ncbi:VOC family protein [Chitinivorax sp. PXF-14]|uniref:VOC family protein n=1 Tax=Chitinivorax sp. PXF-14 TaxID=3230488 RepID=UPI003466150B
MKIEHVAIWVHDLERMRQFYCSTFGAWASDKYCNERTGFESYFLHFEDGARLELMHREDIARKQADTMLGLGHLAIAAGSAQKVEELTEQLISLGCTHLSGPRLTCDGYYESSVLDPEGNVLEITI